MELIAGGSNFVWTGERLTYLELDGNISCSCHPQVQMTDYRHFRQPWWVSWNLSLHAGLEILPEHVPYHLQLILVEKNPQPYTNLELYP